jgi:hypothetical protein
MRAELMLLGKPVDLSLRIRRRMLVASVYAILLLMIAVLAWLSQFSPGWRTGSFFLIFFTLLVNRFLLGGYARGGLIRSFDDREPAPVTPPPYILLGIYMRLSNFSDYDWRNDERELQRRNYAHYQAYQVIAVLLAVLWLLAEGSISSSRWLANLHMQIATVVYLFALGTVLLAITLPQAILLWSEPDMTEFNPEE